MGAARLAARDLCWVCSGKIGVVLARLTGVGSLDRVGVDITTVARLAIGIGSLDRVGIDLTAVARLTVGLLMAIAENSDVSDLTDW